ncbi:Putative membrane protein [Salinisphaera shabanensis E1L3A]|uniref:Membrane protein n=1 Tax=Salinisphaera shabanensis E1L3A TaxID=1033802 RepID=U2EMN7_9GAMM|nr:metal-dependent hydrolase [Salinisphaera shabanensis]ERJ19120.1 Putative membrane protein [Salinisphaera shabanensis E1L3A]
MATALEPIEHTDDGKPDVVPERRDLHFLPPEDRIHDWHVLGAHMTQFMNALSLFFPAGERMFIDAVRDYREEIPDPDLKKAATAFIGQEAIHSREHKEYNDLMERQGLPAAQLDAFVWSFLDFIKKRTPRSFPLSATIALEHFTALMGNSILDYPETMEGSQEDYKRMWQWHALEEIEHKSVAFDVYDRCIGRGPRAYAERATGMVVATAIFWPLVAYFYYRMSRASVECRKEGWRGHLKVFNTLFGSSPGVLRRQIPEWAAYFRYGFHPWQQNNSHHLKLIDDLVEKTDAAYATKH